MDWNHQNHLASASAATVDELPSTFTSTSTSQQPTSTIPPRLPPSLITTILTFILPCSGALPPDLLSKPFQQRLIFLPPGEDEMDKQLSPFPLPVGVNALMERLEALAREHALGKERYGWDGEAYVAKRDLVPEHEIMQHGHDAVDKIEGGLELHFMHEQERGWTFHGLRIPQDNSDGAGSSGSMSGLGTDTPSSASGMVWSDDPSDVSVPLSTSTRSPDADMAVSDALSFSGIPANAESTGHGVDHDEDEEENEYEAELKRQKEASAFWSAWSPEQNPVELPTPSEAQREEDYWAQYSAGPSVAPSTAQSPALPQRRLSERPEGQAYGASGKAGATAGVLKEEGCDSVWDSQQQEDGQSRGQGEGRAFDSAGGSGMGYPFPSTSMPAVVTSDSETASRPAEQPAQIPGGSGASISLNSAPSSPPLPAHDHTSTNSGKAKSQSNNDANLLRTRLMSKMTSLLRRAWLVYTAGVDRQDELEVRGMRWLEIGRSVCLGPSTPTGGAATNGWYAQATSGDSGEQDVRGRMETMYELFDVAYDCNDDHDDGNDGNDGYSGYQGMGEGDGQRHTREERAGRAFYVLIEQAVRPANGAGPGQAEGAERMEVPVGGEMLGRTYSTEQLSFWES